MKKDWVIGIAGATIMLLLTVIGVMVWDLKTTTCKDLAEVKLTVYAMKQALADKGIYVVTAKSLPKDSFSLPPMYPAGQPKAAK